MTSKKEIAPKETVMSYPLHTAIEAEVAYRRERLLSQFRARRRPVGTVRTSEAGSHSSGAVVPTDRGAR